MERERSIGFQLACYNWLIDNQVQLPKAAFMLFLLIVRQTIGYQKEKDFLRYGLISKKTGFSKTTIYSSMNLLLKNNYIQRYDKKNNLLTIIPNGYRGEIYYRVSESLYQKLIQYYNEKWNSTGLKNKPVTVSKNEPYKYKDIQKKITTNYKYKKGGERGFKSDNQPKPGKYDD